MVKYADLADLPEDDRIAIIGKTAEAGKLIAVAIDDDPKKVKRYIKKVTKRFPKARHIATLPGLVANTVTIQFGPLAKH